jgi:hypothetical protein
MLYNQKNCKPPAVFRFDCAIRQHRERNRNLLSTNIYCRSKPYYFNGSIMHRQQMHANWPAQELE